jgi:(S)-mandelate dehydrogenase
LTVLADSGFRRGTDVLKALALGADGVGVVTLLLVAVAARGRDGVRMMIELLNEELQRTMSFVGFPTIADVDPTPLRRISVPAFAVEAAA